MKEFNATNTGNRVIINIASLSEVNKLKNIITKELTKSPLGVKIVGNNKDLMDANVDITGLIDFLKNFLLGLDGNEEFEEALFVCLRKCTYKTSLIINHELFDTICPEAREDYYEIALACIEENLKPFIKSLVSALKTQLQQNQYIQKLFQNLGGQTE